MMAVILLNMHLEEGTSKLSGVWVANSKRNLQKVGIALLVDVYLQGDADVFSNFSMTILFLPDNKEFIANIGQVGNGNK